MGVSVSNLSEEHKKKLENLVTGLYEGGEDEEVIRAFVDEYKTKYGQKSVDQQRKDFAEAVKPKQGILQQTNEQKRLLPRLSKEQEQQQKDMLASPELVERARQNNILKAKKREEYAKSLDARSKNLSKALETSDDAIAKEISERKFNQSNTDFLSNEDVLKSDATAVQGMGYTPQLKDNQVLQSEIDSFKQTASQDPTAQRAALATIARRDPKKSAEIKADIYALDAAQLRNAHDDDNRAATVADNIEKIKSGEFDYDINSGSLIKKESFLQSLATGARERGKQLDLFDKLNNATDEEAQKIIETLDSDIDPDYNPIPVGSELGSALGMESVPMAITTASGLVTKNPYVGAALVAPEYYRRSYVGGFIETYKSLVDQGMDKKEAIQKAREQADQEGWLGAAEGAVSSLIGGRIGLRELPKVNLTGGFKGAVNQLIKESGHFVGETTLDGLTDGVVSGGLQYAKNYLAIDKGVDKSIDDQVYENVKGELMFSFATGAVMKSMSGAMSLSGKVVSKLSYYLAKQDPATVQSFADQLVEEGKATPEEAEAFKKEIDRTRVIDSKVPEDIQESSKVKIVENIKKREDLEKKLETTDKAYHPQIKEDIKAINEKILELSNNKKSEDVQEEKEKVLKPEVVDDVTPQEQPAQEQQQETTQTEIAQPETQPETQQDAKPDAPKQKQDFELELDELFPEAEALAKKAEGMSPEEISKSMDLLGKGGDSVTLQDLGITKEDGTKDIITKLSTLDTPLKPILEFMSNDKDFKNQKVDWYDGTNQTHDNIFKHFGIKPEDFAGLYFEKSTFSNHHVAGEMSGRVLYNPSAVQNHFATIVHEILHNYTLESGKIDGFINTLKKGGRLSDLEDIYNYIAEKKGKDNSDRYDPAKYGTKNFKEFIVELMISPQLREYVGDVVASRSEVKEARPKIKTDFIDKLRRMFIEFVQELFNRSKQEYNGPLVDEAIKALEDLFFGGNQVIDRSGMKWSSQSSGSQGMDFALAMPSKSEKDSIVNKAKSDGTFMKAPNGKPTKLTEDQWVTVRTKAFKDWFGDWENDPQNASKVVDENGEPMVVYHGTPNEFYEFKNINKNITGFYFSNDSENAKTYGPNIENVFLSIKSPLTVNAAGLNFTNELPITVLVKYPNEEQYTANAKLPIDDIVSLVKNGDRQFWEVPNREQYDGVVFDGLVDPSLSSKRDIPQDTLVAFDPNQIKSATSNNGNFSKGDNSILAMKAKSSLSDKNRQDVTNWINKYKDKYSQEQLAAALESKGIDPKEFFDIQKEQGKKALATRAVEGDAPGTTKELLAQRGLDYEVESHAQANEQAEAIIDYLGVDRALQAVRASDIDGAQASFVWAKAIDKIGEEIESEKNQAEVQRLSERQADLLSEYDEMMRTAGRKISALQAVYKMSKLGYKFYIQKQVARLNNEAFSEQDRKQIRELEKKLANVNAQVANLMASNQDLINKLNDKLNKKTLPAEKEARKKELAKKIGDKVRAILNRGPLFMPSKSNPQVDMLMADPEVVEFLNLTYEGSNGSYGFKAQLKEASPELASIADAIFVRLGGQFDDSGTSEKSINNAIKNFFGENPAKKMLEIAREYYIEGDRAKGSLVKYLSEKSGLSESELEEYASQIEARFDDMHSKRVRSEIERIYPRNKMAKKKGKKDYEKMIEAINVGLKTGQRKDGSPFNFVDEFKNKFGFIDNNDPDVRQKIDNFAAKIYSSKGNTLYHAMAVTEMLDWMANNGKENKIVAGLVEQVYANMLYGPDTHFRNTNFNVQKLVSAMITQSLQAKKDGLSAGVVLKELFKGLQRGMLEARNAIRTGDSKAGETPQAKKFSERMAENGNWWGAYASVPSRMLSAMDSAISFPLRQSRMAFILQQELAKQNPGLSKAEIVKMVSEAIDGTSEQVAEWKKRSEEDTMKFYGLDDPMFIDGERNPVYASSKYNEAYRNYNRSYYQMKEDAFLDRSIFDEAKDYADTQLLMSKPKGWFGAGASFVNMIGQMNPLLKVLTSPFVNVPFNIAAHMWEFSPMGYITAMSGKEGAGLGEDFAKRLGIQTELTQRRKRDLLWKATSGTLGMAAVALLTQLEYDDDDEGKRRPVLIVTADGLGNSENSKISGLSGSDQFQEYTVDFMGQRFSYKYSPFAAWFLPTGYIMDEERYGQYGNRTEKPNMELFAKSVAGYMLFMKDQSSLKGVTDLLNIGTEQKTYGKEVPLSQKVADGIKKSGAGFIRNLVLPNAIPQFYRHYKGFMDMQESSGVSFTDRLTKDIPFLDQFAGKKYDHFGKPIDSRWKIPGIYDERPSGNVLYDLARDKAYIDNLKYFRDNRVVDYDGVEHPLTDDQTNAISKRLAEIAGEEFERRFSDLQNMSPDVFKKQANKIFKRSLDKAASEVLGLPINVRGRFMSRDPETAKDLENVPEE